ncbi:MAG: hypothetical protein AAB897_00540 [Patescibacteria group bacterium]
MNDIKQKVYVDIQGLGDELANIDLELQSMIAVSRGNSNDFLQKLHKKINYYLKRIRAEIGK